MTDQPRASGGPLVGATRRRRARIAALLLVLTGGALGSCSAVEAPTAAVRTSCSTLDWVASWSAAPSDASTAFDATFGPLPEHFENQTVRNVITPHQGSTGEVRLRLTNRFNTAPVTFEKVTIGLSEPDGGVDSPVPVSFDAGPSATVAPGEDLVSDPVRLSFDAFDPLAVSLYLPSTSGQVTKHWNSNATTFITPVDGGDQTSTSSGEAFTQTVHSWLGVAALDVQGAPDARAIVTLGDSITDGWVSASADPADLDLSVADENLRYPDYLQHRLDESGIPISVQNAGISGNQVLKGAGMAGVSAVDRFDADVTAVEGARGVIVFEGINDLGLSHAPASAIIEGFEQVIARARSAGLDVWLATITPASDSLLHGVAVAPNSDRDRQTINEWIRTEADIDGYFDFDEAVRDPTNPAVLSTRYASPDRLHLNPAGYARIADAVDLDAIATATC